MIKLKVPNKKGMPNEVNQGDHRVELNPGATVQVEDRKFADHLIHEHGLEEETKTKAAPADAPKKKPVPKKPVEKQAAPAAKPEEKTEGGNN